MLGVSTEVYVTPVQGVTNYSLRRVILIVTSRVSTWEKNRTTVRSVVKTSHIGVILIVTSGVYTRARNRTTVLIVANIFQRDGSLAYTFGLYTMERSSTGGLCVTKGLVREVPLPITSGVYTTERSGKAFDRKQGMQRHMKACNNGRVRVSFARKSMLTLIKHVRKNYNTVSNFPICMWSGPPTYYTEDPRQG